MKYDVLVIGSGFAGLSAALSAREAGASVLVLEKMRAPGGNSIISDGGMAVAGSSLQMRHHIDDSPKQMYRDMLAAGMGLNNPQLVETLCNESESAFCWLTDKIGVNFMDRVDLFGGHSVPRSHGAVKVTGRSIISPMLSRLKAMGVDMLYGHHVDQIVMRGSKAHAVLVSKDYSYKSDKGHSQFQITAERGIVLAGGGFAADISFRSSQDPRLGEEIGTTNKPFAQSDLLCQALSCGALPVQLSHIQLAPWASPDEKGFGDGPLFADYTGFIYGIVIDPLSGKRFVNEQSDRKLVSDALLRLEHPAICISDEHAVSSNGWDISKALKKGVVCCFQNLEDLARSYAIPLNALSASVESFNALALGQKKDPFGRVPPANARGISIPPFYAMRVWPKVHYTMGGIGINPKAQVLNCSRYPIPGLFAAGEITGGIHGASRLGSCAITSCIVFGRIAGTEAAKGEA